MSHTDPWKHRVEGMTCRTCMWFVPKEQGGFVVGRCRKRAPSMGGYPVVFPRDWCGDHKLRDEGFGDAPTQPQPDVEEYRMPGPR